MPNGAVEESAKAAGTLFHTLRDQPLALSMGLMNIALLVFLFFYLSRITTRTETTAAQLFQANDKLFTQWAEVVNDTHKMMERSSHCILPEDALKLINAGIATYGISPLAPLKPLAPDTATRPSEVKP